MNESGQSVQSVERALRILECFTLEKPALSLGELAQQTGLSKSTVFRLLSTLAACGYVKQDPLTQEYSLGFKLFRLGAVAVGNTSLRAAALPYMKQLCVQVSETISLSIVDGDERVCIEMVESPELVRNFVKVGQRNHLCVGASGRVLLAHLDEAEQKRIVSDALANGQLQSDEVLFAQELEHIRQQGYAVAVDERVKGAFAISAPIFDHAGKLAGAITAAGPIQRLTEDRIPFLIEQVVHTAGKISEAMGHAGERRPLLPCKVRLGGDFND